MEYGYVIKISNKNIYREIQLSSNKTMLKVGMDMECDERLYKENFFEQFALTFLKTNNVWSITCTENIYIDAGDVRKLLNMQLKHGDKFTVRYQESNNSVFDIEFVFDFDDKNKDYSRVIDIRQSSKILLCANKDSDIILDSEYTKDDVIEIENHQDSLLLNIRRTAYGVYHNGVIAQNKEKINNGDFFSVGNYSFFYKNQKIMTSTKIQVNNLTYIDEKVPENYPKFSRSSRVEEILDENPIEILDPPNKPQKQKSNLLSRMMPAAMMILICIIMAISSTNGFPVMMLFSVVSGVMGTVTAIIGLVQNKKEYKKKVKERVDIYTNYITGKEEYIKECREEEKNILNKRYISTEDEIKEYESFSHKLFDRTINDRDFMEIYLGTGTEVAKKIIAYKMQEKLEIEDDLQKMPAELCEKYKNVNNVPIVCDLKEINALGIIGKIENRYAIMKNIILDVCARQFYLDVSLVVVANERHRETMRWLRFLPHIYNEEIKTRNLVCNDESRNVIFEYLYRELSIRKETKKYNQNIIVFLFDEYNFYNHPISKFVNNAKELGVTFVFFGNDIADVGQGCDSIIHISKDEGEIYNTKDSTHRKKFNYTEVTDTQAEKICMMLAPIFTEEVSLEGALTKNISLFQLLNILTVEDIDLENNWNNSKVYNSMAAPIGVSKSEVISLDLHDKAMGPHGLVAGTTGSGKSEILQTYILSMATIFHPYEVGFVIIDFKGGGMVNQFKNLPHLMGAITNIDGKEINRSLKSIKAELQKRQKLFAQAEVNHIDKYIKKYKMDNTMEPLPHLIIVVDEFAELKAEQPEFMKELISAARIGRSLGVHLILATQKPSGQVDEQIWSNSRFKLCLKVQDQSDSNEVLKSPLAAEIKEPGRAYLQVGNNEIFELFQSAYSGAPEKEEGKNVKEYKIYALNNTGKRTVVFENKKEKQNDNNKSQLEALVDYIDDYVKKEEITKLPDICLPPLRKNILLPEDINLDEGKYSIGIYDNPDAQYQGNVWMDVDNENTFIIGASQTGKTCILQLLIKQICNNKKANEVGLYIVDFGSMVLKNFENLNHVGGVVISSEEEKLKNLFKLLLREIEERKKKLLDMGVSSISAYYEAGKKDLPHIYVMLDNFAVFKELYSEKYEDELLYIAREGLVYGISVIITASSTSGFGYKYLSNFANHIAFTCNDTSEYANLFARCRIEPDNTPGRMLVTFNKQVYEAQSFLAFKGEKEIDRVNEIRLWAKETNLKNEGLHAKCIPEVPDDLTADYIESNFAINHSQEIAIALSYQYVEPVLFEIGQYTQLALVGKNKKAMVNFEKALIHDLKTNYFERNVELYIVDSITRDLKKCEDEVFVNDYTVDYSQISSVFESVSEKLEERYCNVMENGIDILKNEPLIMMIINSIDAINYISETKEILAIYNAIMSKYKAMKVMIIFGNIEDAPIGYSSSDILKKIKECKNAMIFSNVSEHKVYDIPISFIKQNKRAIDDYQAYYLKEDEIVKVRFNKEE